MHIQRRGERGSEIPVAVIDGIAHDLRPLTKDISPAFISQHTFADIGRECESLPTMTSITSMRVGAPISQPGAIYCVGMNYAKHAAEGGAEPPKDIVVFFKPPHTLTGPDDDIILSPGFTKVDWEVELAIVMGKRAWQLNDHDDSHEFIFGYTLANDVSDRYWQLEVSGGQWSKGKSGPGFLPLGPSILSPKDIDPGNIHLGSWVNGEPRQDSNTADMIFSVERIVRDLSQFTVLEPGDLILTGTPEGVALSGRFPYLEEGDEVSLAIEGMGAQKQRILRRS